MSEEIETVKVLSALKYAENINHLTFLHLYRHMTSIWLF